MRYHVFPSEQHPLLSIYSIGFSADPQITCFGPGHRNQYIVHYVLFGKGYYNGAPVTSGQGFLIRPKTMEHYYPDKDDPWAFLWVISDDPKMEKLFYHYNEDPQTHIFRYDFMEELQQIAQWIMAHSNNFYPPAVILELFLKIFDHHLNTDSIGASKPAASQYIEKAINYIEANMHEPVTVSELTTYLNISQPYLFKIFKNTLQVSPKEYIISRKIAYAKELLVHTDIHIMQVASSVGFDDLLAFSRFFKTHTGVSPKKYRNTQAE